jgi:DNA-binding NtrC family response regulator
MKPLTLLAIDDDQLVLKSLQLVLPDQWRLVAINGLPQKPIEGVFNAAFVDMHLTGNTAQAEGLDIIRQLKSAHPHLEIVAMSGDLDRQLMEQCLKAGASRFLAKPLNPDEVVITLEKIEALHLLQGAAFRHADQKVFWIGQHPLSQNIKRQVAFLKSERGPILIEGESGTGKEVVAQLIHQQEPDKPFIAINVATLPENLFESELFGHVRGAFTGADQNKIGLAEAANGGDLFLDEIEALSLPLQAKLLRFLETGEIRRVGAKESLRVNTRVIVATNRKLEEMVQKGEFREDLLWRLSAKKISLPPLRERKSDIPELANWFLSLEKFRKKDLSQDASDEMLGYSWPGNVRELKRVCEQLSLTAPLPVIRAEDVRPFLATASTLTSDKAKTLNSPVFIDLSLGLDMALSSYERAIITETLKKNSDIEAAAKELKVSRSNLYKKIKDHNITWRID